MTSADSLMVFTNIINTDPGTSCCCELADLKITPRVTMIVRVLILTNFIGRNHQRRIRRGWELVE